MVARKPDNWWEKLKKKLNPGASWPSLMPINERPSSPRMLFGGVFDVVQLSHVFKDSKTFVDMVPKRRPGRILRAFRRGYGAQLDINRFIRDHFAPPPALPEPAFAPGEHAAPAEVREYIDHMWDVLTREADKKNRYSSLLELPYRYIVPGGRFREIYYWDSYFTMLGLREAGRDDLIEEMVRNFGYLVARYGFIPNGNRTYYLSRSQPPLFAMMVDLLGEIRGQDAVAEFTPLVSSEYRFWMRGRTSSLFKKGHVQAREHVVRMPEGEILNRYYDSGFSPRDEGFHEDLSIGRHIDESASFYRHIRAGAESGWDFSSRWLADPTDLATIRTTDIIPVDLNVFLYLTEESLSRHYQRQQKSTLTDRYAKRASDRREAIQKYCWNEEQGWFYDFLSSESRQLAERPSIAGVFPLFAGIATAEQAARVSERIERDFLRPGGVATTLITSPQQWDEPNGWAPLQYITVAGLERYGMHDLAREIACRWCGLNISAYEQTGKLLEKYNISNVEQLASGGEYELQDGFGWTNGVLLTLMNRYHINRSVPEDVAVPEVHEMEWKEPENEAADAIASGAESAKDR